MFITLCACAGERPGAIARIALLAPFEGRYREAGYNAYYAVKLALQEYGKTDVELLAVDDGGTVQSAVARARALAGDSMVKAVIALGYVGTNSETQKAFGDLPVLIVGHWSARPETASIFILDSQEIISMMTINPSARDITETAQINYPIVGDEVLALAQFPLLTQSPQKVTIVSSGSLPDAAFTERYVKSAEFTPQPGLLATLSYDAAALILKAITNAQNDNIGTTIADTDYQGIDGEIRFRNGYWVDAPIHYFSYNADGDLVAVDRPVK